MGKFGKWLLGIYLKGNLKTEDLYKATDYLSYFVKYYNKIDLLITKKTSFFTETSTKILFVFFCVFLLKYYKLINSCG